MQLHIRQVAADAIAVLAGVCMSRGIRVARTALFVVESGVGSAGVLMGGVAGRACQLTRGKAAALRQSKRLETNVL